VLAGEPIGSIGVDDVYQKAVELAGPAGR
jgi:hypothetical protein